MQLIATRVYHDFDPKTGQEYELRDRMLRKACGSFVLTVAGDKPGDPEVEEPCSLPAVYAWLQDLPQQIERAVIWPETVSSEILKIESGLASTVRFGNATREPHRGHAGLELPRRTPTLQAVSKHGDRVGVEGAHSLTLEVPNLVPVPRHMRERRTAPQK